MRRIEITTAFKRDYRRVRASPRHRDIEVLLTRILDLLVADAAQHRFPLGLGRPPTPFAIHCLLLRHLGLSIASRKKTAKACPRKP